MGERSSFCTRRLTQDWPAASTRSRGARSGVGGVRELHDRVLAESPYRRLVVDRFQERAIIEDERARQLPRDVEPEHDAHLIALVGGVVQVGVVEDHTSALAPVEL